MSRLDLRALQLVLLLLAASSCASVPVASEAGPVDRSPLSLFPLRAGAAWSYDIDSGDGQPVLATSQVLRAEAGKVEVKTGQGVQTYLIRPEGIQKSGGYLLLPAQLVAASQWASGPESEARVLSLEEHLVTPAGSFAHCVAIQELNRSSGQSVITTYCPAVGPVRVVSQLEVRGKTLSVQALLRGFTTDAP